MSGNPPEPSEPSERSGHATPPDHPVRQLVAAVAVFVAVGVAATLMLVLSGDGESRQAPRAAPESSAPAPSPPPPSDRVLAVKIDNVRGARPQTGYGVADVVYVEPVEGGLTRLVAVFSSRLPEVVGPVRSARKTDIGLLAQYGHPTLAYSGAAPELVPKLRRAPLNLATEKSNPGAFFRDTGRPSPHNLYVRPAKLPIGNGPGPRHVLEYGPAPAGGVPRREYTVDYHAASYRFAWSPGRGRWLVSMDGAPLELTGSGQANAPTVVIQRVAVHGTGVRDAAGAASPEARTVGSGKATVLRDGKAFHGRWSRPKPGEGTTFVTGDGKPLPMAKGPVWIVLVPR